MTRDVLTVARGELTVADIVLATIIRMFSRHRLRGLYSWKGQCRVRGVGDEFERLTVEYSYAISQDTPRLLVDMGLF